MKRLILFTAAVMMLTVAPVSAANGDMKQPYFTTDILTYMDDIPIRGYSLNGRMMIELESLEGYGFSVSYDDSVRTLFVNKTNEPYPNFNPVYERGTEGELAGYTYESDIIAYVNGKYIPTESVNGRLLAVAEDLGRIVYEGEDGLVYIYRGLQQSEETYNLYGKYGTSRYFMTHIWDSDTRTLRIYNTVGSMPSASERLDMINAEAFKYIETKYTASCEYGTVTAADGICWFVWKSGAYADLTEVFSKYGLTSIGSAKIRNIEFSDDGVYMYFDSSKERAVYPGTHIFESYDCGRYRLDLKNFIITRAG